MDLEARHTAASAADEKPAINRKPLLFVFDDHNSPRENHSKFRRLETLNFKLETRRRRPALYGLFRAKKINKKISRPSVPFFFEILNFKSVIPQGTPHPELSNSVTPSPQSRNGSNALCCGILQRTTDHGQMARNFRQKPYLLPNRLPLPKRPFFRKFPPH